MKTLYDILTEGILDAGTETLDIEIKNVKEFDTWHFGGVPREGSSNIPVYSFPKRDVLDVWKNAGKFIGSKFKRKLETKSTISVHDWDDICEIIIYTDRGAKTVEQVNILNAAGFMCLYRSVNGVPRLSIYDCKLVNLPTSPRGCSSERYCISGVYYQIIKDALLR